MFINSLQVFKHKQYLLSILEVSEFVSLSEPIWLNVALHHAVNGCRQKESPNSWLKHHNNPQLFNIEMHVYKLEIIYTRKYLYSTRKI